MSVATSSETVAMLKPVQPSWGTRAAPASFADFAQRYANPSGETTAIVLIKPPIVFSARAYSTPVTMPIGVAYLAAVLERAGYPVRIVDCPGEAMDQIRRVEGTPYKVQGLDVGETVRRIPASTTIIGVSVMFSQEWPYVRDFVTRLRDAFPKTTIILGGEAVTALPEYSLRDCPAADGIVLGEGEIVFLQLCHALLSEQPWDRIPGVACLDKDGRFVQAGLAPRLVDLREYPRPAWHLVPMEAYFRPNFTYGPCHGRNIGLLATRGCPYSCTFCSNPAMWTTRYVMRDPDDVLDEIEEDIRRYRVDCVDFYDLTAIVRKDWLVAFCHKMLERRITVAWQLPTGTRSEALDAESLSLLARTGCRFLVYAPESGSPSVLKQVKKQLKLENITRSIHEAKRLGLIVKINLIIGLPFERRRDMLATVWFAWAMAWHGVDDCNVATFTPYPGSELFRELVASREIPVLSDAYFESLITQFDLTVPNSCCRHVGRLEILLYRVLGMTVFYGLTYLRQPKKWRSLIDAALSRQGGARSLFEQRVRDLVQRARLAWARRGIA